MSRLKYPLRSSRYRSLRRRFPKPAWMEEDTYQSYLLSRDAIYDLEYLRIMNLIETGKIKRDNLLAVVDIDGLLQLIQLDLIPFFYCPGSVVEEYLKDWTG